MSDALVRLEGLEKRYGRVRALAGVTLDLPPGPVGLLGPNGAGKTTLLEILLGLRRPDGGRARVAGHDPAARRERLALRMRVGYMPEGDALVANASAVELVSSLGRLSGLRARDALARAHEVLDYVGLDEARYRPVTEYSGGMRQRLKLAQALVHDPPLLLLDEPTNGLDPKGRRHMLELVFDLGHRRGKSVLLCSHLLPDVERTCEHVVVLHRGRVLAAGRIGDLTRADGAWSRVELRGAGDAFAAALAAAGVEHRREGPEVFLARAREGDELLALAAGAGAAVASLAPVRSSLEQVFLAALDEAREVAA